MRVNLCVTDNPDAPPRSDCAGRKCGWVGRKAASYNRYDRYSFTTLKNTARGGIGLAATRTKRPKKANRKTKAERRFGSDEEIGRAAPSSNGDATHAKNGDADIAAIAGGVGGVRDSAIDGRGAARYLGRASSSPRTATSWASTIRARRC